MGNDPMTYSLTDFSPGDRVELHPGTDQWMMGARFGTVVKIGRAKLFVRIDWLSGNIRVAPANICNILA
jgi:hypothetical protein